MGLGKVGLDSQGRRIVGDGLRRAALAPQGGSEIAVGLRIVRFQAQGPGVLFDRFRSCSLSIEGVPQVEVRRGVIRVEP